MAHDGYVVGFVLLLAVVPYAWGIDGVFIVCSDHEGANATHVQGVLRTYPSLANVEHVIVTPSQASASLFVDAMWRHPKLATRPLLQQLHRSRAHTVAWAAAEQGTGQSFLVIECNAAPLNDEAVARVLDGVHHGAGSGEGHTPTIAFLHPWRSRFSDAEGVGSTLEQHEEEGEEESTAIYVVTSTAASMLLRHVQHRGLYPLPHVLQSMCGGGAGPEGSRAAAETTLSCMDEREVRFTASERIAFGAEVVWIPPQFEGSAFIDCDEASTCTHVDPPPPWMDASLLAPPGYDAVVWRDVGQRPRPDFEWERDDGEATAAATAAVAAAEATEATGDEAHGRQAQERATLELRHWVLGVSQVGEGAWRMLASALLYGSPVELLRVGAPPPLDKRALLTERVKQLRASVSHEHWLATVILVWDGVDHVLAGSPQELLDAFVSLTMVGGAHVLFLAEPAPYPDNDSLEQLYPNHSDSVLSGGAFLAYAWALEELLLRDPYAPWDQLRLTQAYLDQVHAKQEEEEEEEEEEAPSVPGARIAVDHGAIVFQSTFGARDHVERDPSTGRLRNTVKESRPLLLHANGPWATKAAFGALADLGLERSMVPQPLLAVVPGMQPSYIRPMDRDLAAWALTAQAWTRGSASPGSRGAGGASKGEPVSAVPRIRVAVYVDPGMQFVGPALRRIAQLSYPAGRMSVVVFDGSVEGHATVRQWAKTCDRPYAEPVQHVAGGVSLLEAWVTSLNDAAQWDRCLFVTADTLLTAPDTLQALLAEGKSIVAPALRGVDGGVRDNFWCAVTEHGHFDALRHLPTIREQRIRNAWTVAVAWGAVLVHQGVAPKLLAAVGHMQAAAGAGRMPAAWTDRDPFWTLVHLQASLRAQQGGLGDACTWLVNRRVAGVSVPYVPTPGRRPAPATGVWAFASHPQAWSIAFDAHGGDALLQPDRHTAWRSLLQPECAQAKYGVAVLKAPWMHPLWAESVLPTLAAAPMWVNLGSGPAQHMVVEGAFRVMLCDALVQGSLTELIGAWRSGDDDGAPNDGGGEHARLSLVHARVIRGSATSMGPPVVVHLPTTSEPRDASAPPLVSVVLPLHPHTSVRVVHCDGGGDGSGGDGGGGGDGDAKDEAANVAAAPCLHPCAGALIQRSICNNVRIEASSTQPFAPAYVLHMLLE